MNCSNMAWKMAGDGIRIISEMDISIHHGTVATSCVLTMNLLV